MKLRLGTRGSPLALRQTEEVIALLKSHHPDVEVEIEPIRTTGDRVSEWGDLSRDMSVGAFVRELEESLIAGTIDAAVHSLKDLTTSLPEELDLGAVPLRRNPADALLSGDRVPLEALPEGARIGTGSLRRKAQILALRPDLTVLPLRGNINTRIKKMMNGEFEGIIAAAAGLERLGLEAEITELLDPVRFIPAVGQGALGIEIRRDRADLRELLRPLDHPESRTAVMAERSFLRCLGVGCRAPAAGWARLPDPETLVIRGLVSDPEGRALCSGEKSGPAEMAEELGLALAHELLSRMPAGEHR